MPCRNAMLFVQDSVLHWHSVEQSWMEWLQPLQSVPSKSSGRKLQKSGNLSCVNVCSFRNLAMFPTQTNRLFDFQAIWRQWTSDGASVISWFEPISPCGSFMKWGQSQNFLLYYVYVYIYIFVILYKISKSHNFSTILTSASFTGEMPLSRRGKTLMTHCNLYAGWEGNFTGWSLRWKMIDQSILHWIKISKSHNFSTILTSASFTGEMPLSRRGKTLMTHLVQICSKNPNHCFESALQIAKHLVPSKRWYTSCMKVFSFLKDHTETMCHSKNSLTLVLWQSIHELGGPNFLKIDLHDFRRNPTPTASYQFCLFSVLKEPCSSPRS